MKRPLLWAAVACATGVYTAGVIPGGRLWIAGVTLGVALYALWVRPRRAWRDAVAVLGLFLSVGVALAVIHDRSGNGDALEHFVKQNPGESCIFRGTVVDAPLPSPGTDYYQFTLGVYEIQSNSESFAIQSKLNVQWNGPTFNPVPGAKVEVSGNPNLALGSVNFGVRDIEDYLRARGIFTSVNVRGESVRVTSPAGWSLSRLIYQLRSWEARVLEDAVPSETLPFVKAVWLGERQDLESDTRNAFVLSGTAHILAVSGVHCAIVFYVSNALLALFVHTRKRRAPFIMVAVLLFAFAAGARISTLRAAVMFLLYLTADCFDRERDAPTALGVAGLMFLGVSPALLYDTGFLLSFTSVASLILFSEPLAARLPEHPRRLFRPASAALAVQVLPFPLATHFFHLIPWCAPLVNIPVVALLGVVLWLCLATTLCGLVLPVAAPLFGHALEPIVAIIQYIVDTTADIPLTHFRVTSPTWIAAICYWGAVGCIAAGVHAKLSVRHAFLTGVLFLATAAVFWRPWFPPATLDWIDVGHGDSIFIRTPGGETLLVDGGNRNDYGDAGERYVLPFLFAQGVTQLNCVIATHPDADHLGGLLTVVDSISVGQVLLGPEVPGQPLEKEFLTLCEERGVPVQRVSAGARIEMKGMDVEVLSPPSDVESWKDNDRSLVLRIDWSPVSILLPGDIEARAENYLALQDCAAQIVMAPHHGSATSSSTTYINATSPSHVIISTARSRGRAPVGVGVLERYDERGVQVWRTDQLGGVRLREKDGTFTLTGARQSRGYDLCPSNDVFK